MKILLMLALLTIPVLAQADPCRKTKACKESGYCTFTAEAPDRVQCSMKSDYGCRRSSYCRDLGLCRYVKEYEDYVSQQVCVGTRAGCAKSEVCRENGSCGLFKNKVGRDYCHPTKKAHCKRSEKCKKTGRGCTLYRGSDGRNGCI